MKLFHKRSGLLRKTAFTLLTAVVVVTPLAAHAQFETGIPGASGVQTLNGTENDAQSVAASQAAGGQGNIQAKNTPSGPTSCSGTLNFWSSPVICIGRSLSGVISGALVFLTSWLLTIAGAFFDWLVSNTIVLFKTSIYDKIGSSVEQAWTAFRDIANILIIGIFTFIAISIILGLKEFGEKKLIANVLIIAILINFSLLFTKMIVDASNFTARQIYTASTGQVITSTSNTGATQSYDIAGAFMNYAGVKGFKDTKAAVKQLAENVDNGWIALLHGVFTATLFLAAAAVLLYGCFLLVSRALLIIFLMITASVAFASYLIPKWASSSYGWTTWWTSLVKTAVLAPLLMILLWATLTIAAGISRGAGSGTLGDLIANPTKTLDIAALFNYLVVLGLLFISFKLASVFSSKIAGFNFASIAPALAFGVGARFAGVLGRQVIGRPALNISERLQRRSQQTDSAFARRLYDFGAQRFKGAAQRDFNVMRTPLGAAIQQTAGIKKLDTLAGAAVKGFAGSQDEYKKRMAEAARRMAVSDSDQKKMREDAMNAELRSNKELAQRDAEANAGVDTAKSEVKLREETRNKLEEDFAGVIRGMQDELNRARLAQQAATGADADRARRNTEDVERRITAERQRQKSLIDEETTRIKEAQQLSAQAQRAQKSVNEDVLKAAIASGRVPAEFKKAGDIAEDIVKGSLTSALFKASGLSSKSNEAFARKVAKEAGKQEKQQRIKDEFAPALKDIVKDEHETPATPPPSGGDHGEEHH